MAATEELGDRLKDAIQRLGLTQNKAQEMLEDAGVRGASYTNFYKILANKTSPKADFVVGASNELGVSAGWLVSGEGKMKKSEPLPPEEVERCGLQDLPELIQNDVLDLAAELYKATDRRGLKLPDTFQRHAALSAGIASWLRIPLMHSDKFRTLESDLEATAFCDAALRALRFLTPEPDRRKKTPGGYDKALLALARTERRLAGRSKPPKAEPEKPETVATVRITTGA